LDPAEVLQLLDRALADTNTGQAVPTGVLGLDLALGGGWPGGKVCELSGNPGTGKSTLAYHAAARAQETGTVVWMDSGGFDPVAAYRAGVSLDNLAISRPDNAATALSIMRYAASHAALMVLDTATGLDDGHLYAAALGKLVGYIRADGPPVLITSNDRVNEATTGGFSDLLRQTAPVRVRLRRVGRNTQAEVTKNGAVPPATHPIRFRIDLGYLDWTYELVVLGLHAGVLHKRGTWICTDDLTLGQGASNAATAIRAAGLGYAIHAAIIHKINGGTPCP
jgi:recombination protein RecA